MHKVKFNCCFPFKKMLEKKMPHKIIFFHLREQDRITNHIFNSKITNSSLNYVTKIEGKK